MLTRAKLFIGGLAALLVGMPLAGKAAASNGLDIAFASVGLAAAITEAAIEAS